MIPYICENIAVKSNCGREGRVIGVDRKNKVAVIKSNKLIWTSRTEDLIVLSYKEVW